MQHLTVEFSICITPTLNDVSISIFGDSLAMCFVFYLSDHTVDIGIIVFYFDVVNTGLENAFVLALEHNLTRLRDSTLKMPR